MQRGRVMMTLLNLMMMVVATTLRDQPLGTYSFSRASANQSEMDSDEDV